MPATLIERDYQRAARWIERSGGMSYVPPEAFDLLARRLEARQRNVWLIVALAPVLLAAMLVLPFAIDSSARALTVADLGACVAASLLATGMGVLNNRAERRIASALPRRLSRSTAVSVLSMFGRRRVAAVVAMMLIDTGFGVEVAWRYPGWQAATHLGGVAALVLSAVLRVRLAATRATIAIDQVSLALDERLRSTDAYAAFAVLYVVFIVILYQGLPGPAIGTAGLVLYVVVCAIYFLGMAWRPWPRLAPRAPRWPQSEPAR